VEVALEKSLGVVVHAAGELGVDRRTLYNYLKRERIDVNRFRRGFGGHG
jgi:transcriptional regulator of acetoin/glycerol metabolism